MLRLLTVLFFLAAPAQAADVYDITYSTVMGNLTSVIVVFAKDPGSAAAEKFLRQAMLQAIEFDPTKDISGAAEVGKPRGEEDGRPIKMHDGSTQLVYKASQKKIVTEKEYEQSELAALPKGKPIDVRLSVDAKLSDDGSLIVTGTSNLPAGMILTVSIADSSGVPLSQVDAHVQADGKYAASLKSDKGPWAPATYQIEIISQVSDLQPAAVQRARSANRARI